MIYLIPVLITLAVFVALMGALFFFPRKQRVSARLSQIRGEGEFVETEKAPIMVAGKPLPRFLQAVATIGWLLPPLVQSESVRLDLAEAGFRREGVTGLFVAVKVILAVALGLIVYLIASNANQPHNELAFFTLGATALGFYLPNIWLRRRSSGRQEMIRQALPDALDLMVVCVEAGQGLNAAILTVGKEMSIHAVALSQELRVINQEIRTGLTRSQALRNFADRTGVDEARSLVAVLIQSDKLGTSIAQALRVHAQGMRTRRRQRAEEAARKTAVKLLFPLIFCIFPELMVVILAPAMIQILRALAQSANG